jgi:hypothetical protein
MAEDDQSRIRANYGPNDDRLVAATAERAAPPPPRAEQAG